MVTSRLIATAAALALLAGSSLATPAHAAILYVDAHVSSSSSGSGASWNNATTTIQDAVDQASKGDEIWIAAGTYVEDVYIDKGLSLYGSGANSTFRVEPPPAPYYQQGAFLISTSDTVRVEDIGFVEDSNIIANGDTNLQVRDCRFIGDGTSATAIMFNEARGRIRDSHFEGYAHAIWVTDAGSKRLYVNDNTFLNNEIGIWLTTDADNPLIRDNTFENSGDAAIKAKAPGASATITRNLILDGVIGVSLHNGSHKVTNNIIDGAGGAAFQLLGSQSDILHNTVVDAGFGVACLTPTWYDSSLIANNAFLGNTMGFYGDASCQAELLNNAFHDSAWFTTSGSFVDLGDNLFNTPFALSGYRPDTSSSPLYHGGTPVGVNKDYYRKTRGSSPSIGAVEQPLIIKVTLPFTPKFP